MWLNLMYELLDQAPLSASTITRWSGRLSRSLAKFPLCLGLTSVQTLQQGIIVTMTTSLAVGRLN